MVALAYLVHHVFLGSAGDQGNGLSSNKKLSDYDFQNGTASAEHAVSKPLAESAESNVSVAEQAAYDLPVNKVQELAEAIEKARDLGVFYFEPSSEFSLEQLFYGEETLDKLGAIGLAAECLDAMYDGIDRTITGMGGYADNDDVVARHLLCQEVRRIVDEDESLSHESLFLELERRAIAGDWHARFEYWNSLKLLMTTSRQFSNNALRRPHRFAERRDMGLSWQRTLANRGVAASAAQLAMDFYNPDPFVERDLVAAYYYARIAYASGEHDIFSRWLVLMEEELTPEQRGRVEARLGRG